MAAIPNGLTRDEFALALFALNPAYEYRFTSDDSYDWRGPGDPPTDNAILTAWTVYEAEEAQRSTDATTARAQAVTIAQSAVGQSIGALTAPQVRALVACLLWKNGALHPSGTVRALSDWL